MCCDSARGGNSGPHRGSEDRLHDRIHGDGECHNIRAALDGHEPSKRATWNAVCLADFGDKGVAFVALPQIPPRNVSWVGEDRWVHLSKVAFEKYFLRKVRAGTSEPAFEKVVLKALGIMKLKS